MLNRGKSYHFFSSLSPAAKDIKITNPSQEELSLTLIDTLHYQVFHLQKPDVLSVSEMELIQKFVDQQKQELESKAAISLQKIITERLFNIKWFSQSIRAEPRLWAHPSVLLQWSKLYFSQRLPLMIIQGNLNEAKAIVKAYPDLLYKKNTTIDFSGRTIQGAPLQIALGAEDWGIQKDEEAMVEMLIGYLQKQPDGSREIARQWQEQFPDGFEKIAKRNYQKDLAILKKVFGDIEESALGNCKIALLKFRSYMKKIISYQPIKTGIHFEIQLLIDALDLYCKNFNKREEQKNQILWCKVIGYLQRLLPACYAQAVCQGLFVVVNNHKKLERSFQISSGSDKYYPLKTQGDLGCKFGFAGISGLETGGGSRSSVILERACSPGVAGTLSSLFSNLVNKKRRRRDEYASQFEIVSTSRPSFR